MELNANLFSYQPELSSFDLISTDPNAITDLSETWQRALRSYARTGHGPQLDDPAWMSERFTGRVVHLHNYVGSRLHVGIDNWNKRVHPRLAKGATRGMGLG